MVDPEVVVCLEFGDVRISFWALKSSSGGKLTLHMWEFTYSKDW